MYLPIIAVRYPAEWSRVAKVEFSCPSEWKSLKPPSLPLFVKTPVSCGSFPVKIDARDGQQSESVTK